MSVEMINRLSSCEILSTEGHNESQIESARLSRYGAYGRQAEMTVQTFLRVLVVDDHRDEARMLEILITRWGHDCRIAVDGASGLQMALEFPPDVLLLDVVMPRMSGAELAVKVRNEPRLRDCLIIALSGSTGAADREECACSGVDQYLVKPVSSSALKTLLAMEADFVARRLAAAVVSRQREAPLSALAT